MPKTLIQHLIRWVVEHGAVRRGRPTRCCESILDTEISPELVPGRQAKGDGATAGAEDRGHDRPLRAAGLPPLLHSRYGFRPSKVAFLACTPGVTSDAGSWPPACPKTKTQPVRPGDDQALAASVPVPLFPAQPVQALGDAERPKVGSGGSLSPRGDWRRAVRRLVRGRGSTSCGRTCRTGSDGGRSDGSANGMSVKRQRRGRVCGSAGGAVGGGAMTSENPRSAGTGGGHLHAGGRSAAVRPGGGSPPRWSARGGCGAAPGDGGLDTATGAAIGGTATRSFEHPLVAPLLTLGFRGRQPRRRQSRPARLPRGGLGDLLCAGRCRRWRCSTGTASWSPRPPRQRPPPACCRRSTSRHSSTAGCRRGWGRRRG